MEVKEARRAGRYQRNARHARRAPNVGRRDNSLAREGDSPVTLALLFALFVVLALICGLGDRADVEAHDKWMADLKEHGAWVMW